jgi:hypothetical protein
MRHRPVKNPEPHLAAAVDGSPIPGRAETLTTRLLDAGVPPESVRAVEDVVVEDCIRFASTAIARILRSLEGSPAALALQRAVMGACGRSLADDADAAGTSKQALQVAESRVRARLEKVGG